jgi:hypothetical protein
VDAVDGGLEAVGTSFGSLSLATEDQRKLVRVLEAENETPQQCRRFSTRLNQEQSVRVQRYHSDGEDESATKKRTKRVPNGVLQATFQA